MVSGRDEDPDPVGSGDFWPLSPDPVLISTDPDPWKKISDPHPWFLESDLSWRVVGGCN